MDLEVVKMNKKWFLGNITKRCDAKSELCKFANDNNIAPGELIILKFDHGEVYTYIDFMYFSEKEIKVD